MKRRSFLSLIGLAPLTPSIASAEPKSSKPLEAENVMCQELDGNASSIVKLRMVPSDKSPSGLELQGLNSRDEVIFRQYPLK